MSAQGWIVHVVVATEPTEEPSLQGTDLLFPKIGVLRSQLAKIQQLDDIEMPPKMLSSK